ncbi:uncharacterized protein LAESUDRAFT_723999 [Laetiporus sulphureus 93-53]|uniref:PPIase cyclophilin-type domain-containing protein n=1 Tax=Laetiporus sulphureus 93-53 TaxID=1314785 RepID=A0A165F6D1_9APHY|nr:uncharacterized protein LAESUDRAFT_723999 [Laetiporus sulphureus 93-53]KZT08479.1 hypothetical protein LAESUDRAFT_723999 [Laetiporus sulphureus 93-53]
MANANSDTNKSQFFITYSKQPHLDGNLDIKAIIDRACGTTREEYMEVVDKVKEAAPIEPKEGGRRTKLEQAHLALLKLLEERIEVIDAEIARIQRARKKIERRNLLIAQAEVRETRTRRRTICPDYAYMNDPTSEFQDDQDEYTYQEQEDEDYDKPADDDDLAECRGASGRYPGIGRRRSTRATHAVVHARWSSGAQDDWNEWCGERCSTRLGATADMQLDGPPKRARTEDSLVSNGFTETQSTTAPAQNGNGLKIKMYGAAAVKPTEMVVEAVAGKKRSKYWCYAVEPVPALQVAPDDPLGPRKRRRTEKAGLQSSMYPEQTPDNESHSGTNGDVVMHDQHEEDGLSTRGSPMDQS